MARAARWLLLTGAVVALGAFAWQSSAIGLEDRFFPRHFAQVAPALYRSGQIDRHIVEDVLREHGIDTVVDLQGAHKGNHQAAETDAAARLGVEYRLFTLGGDGEGGLDEYGRAVACIAHALDAGRSVLVHCASGARRTGGVLAAYELLVRGDAGKAREELERYTGGADGCRDLRTFLNANRVGIAAQLVGLGVLTSLPPHIPEIVDGH